LLTDTRVVINHSGVDLVNLVFDFITKGTIETRNIVHALQTTNETFFKAVMAKITATRAQFDARSDKSTIPPEMQAIVEACALSIGVLFKEETMQPQMIALFADNIEMIMLALKSDQTRLSTSAAWVISQLDNEFRVGSQFDAYRDQIITGMCKIMDSLTPTVSVLDMEDEEEADREHSSSGNGIGSKINQQYSTFELSLIRAALLSFINNCILNHEQSTMIFESLLTAFARFNDNIEVMSTLNDLIRFKDVPDHIMERFTEYAIRLIERYSSFTFDDIDYKIISENCMRTACENNNTSIPRFIQRMITSTCKALNVSIYGLMRLV